VSLNVYQHIFNILTAAILIRHISVRLILSDVVLFFIYELNIYLFIRRTHYHHPCPTWRWL